MGLRRASVPGGEDAGGDELELDFFFLVKCGAEGARAESGQRVGGGQRRRVSAAGEEAN